MCLEKDNSTEIGIKKLKLGEKSVLLNNLISVSTFINYNEEGKKQGKLRKV